MNIIKTFVWQCEHEHLPKKKEIIIFHLPRAPTHSYNFLSLLVAIFNMHYILLLITRVQLAIS